MSHQGRGNRASARRVVQSLVLTLVLAAWGCGGGTSGNDSQKQVSPGLIGPAGGVVTSDDGLAVLIVPPNAVLTDTQFTLSLANGAPPSARIVGPIYDIEPTGTVFQPNARPELRIAYTSLPTGVDPTSITIGTLVNGQWNDVAGSRVDAIGRTVTTSLEHLSPYTLLRPAESPGPPANQPPIATAGGPYVAQVNQVIVFSAVGTSDPNNDSLTYTWSFGDVSSPVTVATQTTTYAYASEGVFTVTLTVSDGRGGSHAAQTSATITQAPPQNSPPIADAGGPYAATVGQAISFSAAKSSDLDGDNLIFAWEFGDGGTAMGMTPSYTYTSDRTWPVKVTVSDPFGAFDEDVTTATISPAPSVNRPPTITGSTIPAGGVVNQTLVFDVTASDPDGDTLAYRWDFGDQTSAPLSPSSSITHAYGAAGTFTVTVTVEDGRGGVASATAPVAVTMPVRPIAFSQDLWIYMRQGSDAIYRWKYAIPLSGTGTPPLTFRIVSFPVRQDPGLSTMPLVAGSYYQWWDASVGGWRLECRASPPSSCRATTSSQVDRDATNYVVDPTVSPPQPIQVPSSVPPIVVYAPISCYNWGPNPLVDSFSFTVTDGTGATSDPATVSITVAPAICKDGTH